MALSAPFSDGMGQRRWNTLLLHPSASTSSLFLTSQNESHLGKAEELARPRTCASKKDAQAGRVASAIMQNSGLHVLCMAFMGTSLQLWMYLMAFHFMALLHIQSTSRSRHFHLAWQLTRVTPCLALEALQFFESVDKHPAEELRPLKGLSRK